MIDFGRSFFVCSKPLQFFVCASIVRHYRISHAHICLVTGSFSQSDPFIKFVATSEYRNMFAISSRLTHGEVAADLALQEYDSLFIEDDRVSMYSLYAPQKRRFLSVLEEGIGTYVTDYRAHMDGLRKLKWQALSRLTGCGLDFGGGRKTDYVLVQRPDLYRSLRKENAHKVAPIPPVVEEMLHVKEAWHQVIDGNGLLRCQPDSKVALLLGTWNGVPLNDLSEISKNSDLVYYKAHPHDNVPLAGDRINMIPESWIPAEVYLDWVAGHCHSLTVYHFSSTIEFNCTDAYPSVKFVDLGNSIEIAAVRARMQRLSADSRKSEQ